MLQMFCGEFGLLEEGERTTPSVVHNATPSPLTRWTAIAVPEPRSSFQAAIAPPEPSETMTGSYWPFTAAHSATFPFNGFPGHAALDSRTRRIEQVAQMSRRRRGRGMGTL